MVLYLCAKMTRVIRKTDAIPKMSAPVYVKNKIAGNIRDKKVSAGNLKMNL